MSLTASVQNIRFQENSTKLLFSQTRQKLIAESPDQRTPRVDQRSLSQCKVTYSPQNRFMAGSQIKVHISNDLHASKHFSQQFDEVNAQHHSDTSPAEDPMNQTKRMGNNVTPSTVYNGAGMAQANVTNASFDGNITLNNAASFRPRLTPINLNPEMPNQTQELTDTTPVKRGAGRRQSPKTGSKAQPKNLQSIMVNMLKQQVQKRRKNRQKASITESLQIEDIQVSQSSSIKVGNPNLQESNSRHQQTTPVDRSKTRRERSARRRDNLEQDSQAVSDTNEDEVYKQQIVFNMLSPKMPNK